MKECRKQEGEEGGTEGETGRETDGVSTERGFESSTEKQNVIFKKWKCVFHMSVPNWSLTNININKNHM